MKRERKYIQTSYILGFSSEMNTGCCTEQPLHKTWARSCCCIVGIDRGPEILRKKKWCHIVAGVLLLFSTTTELCCGRMLRGPGESHLLVSVRLCAVLFLFTYEGGVHDPAAWPPVVAMLRFLEKSDSPTLRTVSLDQTVLVYRWTSFLTF